MPQRIIKKITSLVRPSASAEAPRTPAEPSTPAAPRPQSKRSGRIRWLPWTFTLALVVLVVVFVVRQVDDFIRAGFASHSIYGWLSAVALAVLGLAVLVVVVLEIRGYLALTKNTQLRLAFERIEIDPIDTENLRRARRETKAWLSHLSRRAEPELRAAGEALKIRMDQDGDPRAWRHDLETTIFGPLDQRARDIIQSEAIITGVSTALSPFAFVDAAVSMWRNTRTIRQVAAVYRVRPGFVGTLALVRRTIVSVALADLSQEAVGLLAPGLIRTAGGMGQGAMNALMTIRLGLSAQRECRPLPFPPGAQPGMMRLMWAVVRGAVFKRKGPDTEEIYP
jgi:putative membrane protein